MVRYLTTTYARQRSGQGQTLPEQLSIEDMNPDHGMNYTRKGFVLAAMARVETVRLHRSIQCSPARYPIFDA